MHFGATNLFELGVRPLEQAGKKGDTMTRLEQAYDALR
jgi:hypothetical protein